jgi:hypothetical protein
MKQIKIFTLLFFALALIFSCTRENIDFDAEPESTGCTSISIDDFNLLGEIHNDALTNVLEAFEPDTTITTLEGAIDQIVQFNTDFLEDQFENTSIDSIVASHMQSSNWLVVTNWMYDSLYSINSSVSLAKLVNNLFSNEMIDSIEKVILNRVANLVEENYNGYVDAQGLKDTLLVLRSVWNSQGYTTCSTTGYFAAAVLSIGIRSTQWWIDNPNAHGEDRIAPWIALDAAGALVGAGIAAGAQYAVNGEVGDWGVVGVSAVGAGIAASTGIIGRGVNGLADFFNELYYGK